MKRYYSLSCAALAGAAMVMILAGCEDRVTREVRAACANAPNVSKCQDAEFNRRAAADWADFNRGRVYP